MTKATDTAMLIGKPNLAIIREARKLTKVWVTDNQRFVDTVDRLLDVGGDEILFNAVQLLASKDEADAEMLDDEIRQMAESFADETTDCGNLVCLPFSTEKPQDIDLAELIKSYTEASSVGCAGGSYSFHPKLMPWETLSMMGPCEVWDMMSNMRKGQPPFTSQDTLDSHMGWYVLIGLRKAPAGSEITSPITPRSAIQKRRKAEKAWRESVLEAMPGIRDVIAPEVHTHVAGEWIARFLEASSSAINEEFFEFADGLAKVVDHVECTTEKDVESIQIRFTDDEVTGEGGIRACFFGEDGENLGDVFRIMDVDSFPAEWLEMLEEIVGISIEIEGAAVAEADECDLDPSVPPDTVFH